VATEFVSYIQTRLPLTTAFVCLLLGLRLSSPPRVPSVSSSSYLRLPSLLLFPFVATTSSSSSSSALSSSPSHCLRIALPLPYLSTNLSLLSLSLCCFAFAATTTTWRFFRSHHYHHSDPHHHVSLSLWHFLFLPPRRTPPLKAISFSGFIQFFFYLTWFYIFRSLPLLCRLFSTIVVHTLPLSLIFRFIHSIFMFN